jgi:hypothetical protein
LIVDRPDPITLEVTATNTGQAVWLAHGRRDEGAVKLGWRWFRDGAELAGLSGRAPIRYDVFPEQGFRFKVAVDPPAEPGRYLLELGLVSELVTWFSQVGTPPLRLTVDVRADLRFTSLIERLKIPAPDAPRFFLATDRAGEVSRLTLGASVGERSWVVDVYLVLQAPDGAVSFYDGQRLVPHRKGPWVPLVKGVELRKGTRDPAPLVSLPVAGMRPGTYTWYLLLTEAHSYRIIVEARATFEVAP